MSVEKITKACPFCGEQILEVAVKCKHCQSALTELPVIGFPLGADIAKSQGNSSQSAAVANELTSHKAEEKNHFMMSPFFGIGMILACVVGIYFYIQPGCDTDSVKETVLRLLDQKFLHLSENLLDQKDVVKSLENITKTSSNDDAKACMANLVLNFTKPIADHLGRLASSTEEPNFHDPQLPIAKALVQAYLQKTWNVSKNRLEITLEYRYTKDSVMMGGGLEGLSLLGLDGVLKYVGKIKPAVMAQSSNQDAKSATVHTESSALFGKLVGTWQHSGNEFEQLVIKGADDDSFKVQSHEYVRAHYRQRADAAGYDIMFVDTASRGAQGANLPWDKFDRDYPMAVIDTSAIDAGRIVIKWNGFRLKGWPTSSFARYGGVREGVYVKKK